MWQPPSALAAPRKAHLWPRRRMQLRGVRLAPEPWPSPVARARKGLGKNAIPEPSLEQRSARDPAGTEAAEGTADASAADEGCPGEREDHGIAPRLSSAAAAVAVAAGSARVTGRGSRRREVKGLRDDSVPGTTRGVRGTEGNGEREKGGRGSHRAGHRESEKERGRERGAHTQTHTHPGRRASTGLAPSPTRASGTRRA